MIANKCLHQFVIDSFSFEVHFDIKEDLLMENNSCAFKTVFNPMKIAFIVNIKHSVSTKGFLTLWQIEIKKQTIYHFFKSSVFILFRRLLVRKVINDSLKLLLRPNLIVSC